MQSEYKFVQELENRADEQQRLIRTKLIPGWARWLGDWLAVNPWRMVLPLAIMIYGLGRLVYGIKARELILGLFGGFAR